MTNNYSRNNHCIDCNKLICNNAKRCYLCEFKGNKYSYIDGRSYKRNKCIICGKVLSRSATYNKKNKCGKCVHRGKKLSVEHKKKIGISLIGNKRNLGKKHSEEHNRKISLGGKGRIVSIEGRKNISKGLKGRIISKEWKNNLSKSHIGIFGGDKNPSWQGGISFEPYSPLFNKQLKERIRVRDNFICQKCGTPELELNQRLCNHHIDYNKKNCNENNLISLCKRCNGKVNKNREYWTDYFNTKIEVKVG